MRRLSTRIGVYAILLITAFYGALSFSIDSKKSSLSLEVIIRKSTTSTEVRLRAKSQQFLLHKNNKSLVDHSVPLHIKMMFANAGAESNFFNQSAISPYHINTL